MPVESISALDPYTMQFVLKQPSGAFVSPEALAELALFLCSDAGSQVRGVAWNMDGGWIAQ